MITALQFILIFIIQNISRPGDINRS